MSHAAVKSHSDHQQPGRFDSRSNVKRKSSHSYKNKTVKKQTNTVVPTLDCNRNCDEVVPVEQNSNDQESVIEMFTTARTLLNKPLDYSRLSDVQTRCMIIMKILENTIESLAEKKRLPQSPNNMETDSYLGLMKCTESKLNLDQTEGVQDSQLFSSSSLNEIPTKNKRKRKFNTSDSYGINETVCPAIDDSTLSFKTDANTNLTTSSELLHTLFPSLNSSNSWELMQLKQMLADPFISNIRRQCLNTRMLELNEKIITELFSQADKCKHSEVFVLEKLCNLSADCSLSLQQKEQVDFILSAFRDKVVRDIINSVLDPNQDYEFTIERLNALIKVPCISDKEKVNFMSKLIDMRSKLSNDLINRTNSSAEDATKILEKIKNLVDDPFLSDRARSRLISYIGFVRNKSIQVLTTQPIQEAEDNEELIKKLSSLLQDSSIPYSQRMKVIEKLQQCESTVMIKLKHSKQQLKEALVSSADETLGFEGTNLDFVAGYSVESPPYVRCINIWTLQEL